MNEKTCVIAGEDKKVEKEEIGTSDLTCVMSFFLQTPHNTTYNQLPSFWPHDPHNLTKLWRSLFFFLNPTKPQYKSTKPKTFTELTQPIFNYINNMTFLPILILQRREKTDSPSGEEPISIRKKELHKNPKDWDSTSKILSPV